MNFFPSGIVALMNALAATYIYFFTHDTPGHASTNNPHCQQPIPNLKDNQDLENNQRQE